MARPSRGTTTDRRPAHRRLVIVALAVGAVLVLTVLGVIGVAVSSFLRTFGQTPPGPGTIIVTPTDSAAADAAADPDGTAAERASAEYLSHQPTASWLTPEMYDESEVGGRVADLAAEARAQDATLALVVYGIPARDCGNLSAGGLANTAEYHRWTTAIGAALTLASDVRAVVVLEPDSLALAPDCGDVDERIAQLRIAVDDLAGADRWIYLDGGHSNWRPAAEMAGLIRQVDRAGDIRGFATNVSNYNPSADEVTYAHDLADALGGGMHALIDTGRNGAGTATTWCNPPRQLIGEPGGALGDDVVDTNLWIKPPGESDGTCNGGPAAGDWWPESAAELTRNAR